GFNILENISRSNRLVEVATAALSHRANDDVCQSGSVATPRATTTTTTSGATGSGFSAARGCTLCLLSLVAGLSLLSLSGSGLTALLGLTGAVSQNVGQSRGLGLVCDRLDVDRNGLTEKRLLLFGV